MRKVLIVVDMINDFVSPDGALYCGPTIDEIVPVIKEKIEEYNKNDDFVIFLNDAHDIDDLEFKLFPVHAVRGTGGARIFGELRNSPKNFSIIKKTRYNGFFKTTLEDTLDMVGSNDVELVGCCTSICVMDTAGDLANRDYKIKVDKRAVADFDPEMHKMALKRMENLYGVEVV